MEKWKKEKKRIHESKLKKEREAEQKALEYRSTKQKILNKDNYTKLKQSDVWSKTIGERHALDVFHEKISGYFEGLLKVISLRIIFINIGSFRARTPAKLICSKCPKQPLINISPT